MKIIKRMMININEIYIKIKEKRLMRKVLANVIIFTLTFVMGGTGKGAVFSDEVELAEFEQVIIGSYSVWLHADGRTWQNNEKQVMLSIST